MSARIGGCVAKVYAVSAERVDIGEMSEQPGRWVAGSYSISAAGPGVDITLFSSRPVEVDSEINITIEFVGRAS